MSNRAIQAVYERRGIGPRNPAPLRPAPSPTPPLGAKLDNQPASSELVREAVKALAEAETVHPDWTKADVEFMVWRLCGIVHGFLGHNVTPKPGDA